MAEKSGEARLFVLAGPDLARSFALGERTTLGRSDECDVVLRDRSISRKHAAVVRQGAQWFVQDLGSTNGVSKNGQRAERFELTDGDEFRLGDLPLRFKLQAEATPQDIEFDLGPERGADGASRAAPAQADGKRAQPAQSPVPQPSRPAVKDAEPEKEEVDEIEIEGPDEPLHAGPLAATTFRPPRVERRTGLFAGDIEQHPFWLRIVLVLLLLALGSGLAYGAFRAVQMLRAGL